MTEFLIVEELWLANGFEIHCVSQEHGTIFLFWKQGLYSFGVILGRKRKIYIKISIFTMENGLQPLGI